MGCRWRDLSWFIVFRTVCPKYLNGIANKKYYLKNLLTISLVVSVIVVCTTLLFGRDGYFDTDVDCDIDHERHAGWTSDQVLDLVTEKYEHYSPDLVLIHLWSQ